MSIANEFLAEFESQAPITRKFLERVPQDKLTWKPHEKSLTAGQLALHIARVPSGILHLVQNNPAQAPGKFNFPQPATLDEVLAAFDENAATVRSLLPSFSDAAMKEAWVLKFGDRVMVEQPRAHFLRDIMFSHVYQHRGQLCVYLRLLDVPVPSSWGPSADEAPNFTPREVMAAY
ncbi:MAG: DinB family protein [Terracidiphilus sp.]